jgi:hypothetical protein
MKVMIQNARLAFPALFEAKTVNGEGDPAFSAALILDPEANASTIDELDAAIKQVAEDKWGVTKAEAVLKKLETTDKLALHDGDTKADYDGFPGNKYVSSRSKTRPTVVDRDRTPLAESDGKPYAGCYVNAQVDIWAQDNNYGKRINAQLRGVQFVKDGKASAGGGAAAADDFEELEPETADDLV